MTQYYSDLYGSTASIKKWGNKWILTARTCYGDIFYKKNYETYRGVKIALGKIGECWREKE